MAITLDKIRLRQGDFSLSANIDIKSCQTTAVIGPSGGGKSTLLMVLAGFIQPDSGAVLIQKRNITALPPGARPLSVLFQENNLFPHLSVFQNTALGFDPNLKLSAKENSQVMDALKKVGLAERQKDIPAALSGGQRQRVALARALLRRQPVLLLDEPFAALGPALRHEMLDLVAQIQKTHGTTVLLVTHNPDDALRIAAQTILVTDGQVSQPENTVQLFKTPPDSLKAYLGVSRAS